MDQRGLVPWRPASSRFHELTPKQRREDMLLQRFPEEQNRQENARRIYDIKNMEAACQMRDHRRRLIHQTFQERLRERRIRELYEVSAHASLLTSWNNVERQDYATEVDVFEKITGQVNLEMEVDCCNFEEDLKIFERKGYELGAETASESALEPSNKEKGKEKRKDNSKLLKDTKGSKKSKPDDTLEATQQEESNYLFDIKERVLRAEKEKFETKQKCRLDALETKQREREMEDSIRKKEEDDKALRDLEDKSLKAKELQAAENEEKEKIAFRLELEQQISEQRNREWEAVLARDHELLLMIKHDRDNEVNFEQRVWQEERLKRLQQKQLKHRQLCHEVLLQIVSLAESSAIYKASTNCALSNTEWWEWRNLFVKGAIQPFILDTKPSTMDAISKDEDQVAEEAAVMDYIKEQGEWEAFEPVGTNKELGKLLVSLFQITETASNPEPPAFLSRMQLKLAVIGSPFGGKSFVAKLLEDQFGVVRIEIEKVIASAIAAAEAEETSKIGREDIQELSNLESSLQKNNEKSQLELLPSQEKTVLEGIKSPNASTRLSLGRQARTALTNGFQVPDEVTIQLLLLTLECLDDCGFQTPSASPKDKKKKDPSSKEPSPRPKTKEDTQQSSQKCSTPPASQRKVAKEKNLPSKEGNQLNRRGNVGFVLDGFPNTRRQAAILQKGLSGLELCLASNRTAYRSLIAPPPESDLTAIKPVYPLDALFVLDPLGEGDALKQAMGKYIDPKTGLLYHLENDPPPANDRTGIAGRLKPIEDVTAAGKRINEGMLIWNLLFEWISTFSNVNLIHRDQERRLKMEDACIIIQGFLDAKLKLSAAADAEKAAVEADEAATKACCEAEKASFQAKAVAQKLFLSKLAEVEALSLLERSSNDPAAKDILKKKVSESTSRILQEAANAVTEAEGSAEAARKAAEDAFHAKQVAEEAVSSVGAINQAKEEALAAAEVAKQSASRAAAASQRAQIAVESASLSLADTNNCFESSDKNFLREKILDLSTRSMQGQVELKPLMLEKAPHSRPHSSQVEPSFAENLCKLWQDIESTYLKRLKECFGKLRTERKETQKTLKEVKDTFAGYLKKPDERQNCLNDFQGKYNRVDASQRSTVKMKKQLQKKAEDLFLKLHSICEGFLKEAEATCKKSLNTWTQQRVEEISRFFTIFIQIELERFLQICCFLHEFHFKTPSSPIKDKFSNVVNVFNPTSKQVKLLSMPGWLPSIVETLPQLYQVLQQAILAADAIAKATSESQSTNSYQPGPKTPSKNPKAIAETTMKKETLQSEKNDLVAKAIQDEMRILLLNFQRLASKACSHICDLEVLIEGAKIQMENWIEKSHKAKIEITEEVLNIVQEAIEESIPLWFYMCIDGDHFTIDESQLQLDPPQPLGLHPLPNLASYHYQVLQELVRTFQTDCIKGYVSLVKAAEAVHKAVEYVHSTCKKNDLTLSMTPRIPSTKRRPGGPFEVWKDYTKEILKISSIGETQVIDWRCLLVSLVDVHYHNFISTASVIDILQAHISLKEATKGSSTYMDLTQFLGTRLWFDSDSVCDVGASMKKLFYIMLDSDSGIPWQSLLLYLCKDSETELALKKAHAAILGTLSENVSLTTHELLQAMYPCGIEGALDQGCQIWSLQDLQKLMEKQQRRQELESFGTESDDNRASRSGYDSDACAKSTGACRGSKLSEQSTMSFQNLMMPYELQSISEKTAGSASSTSEASNQTAISGTQKKAAGEASASEKESNAGAFEGSSEFSERAVATMNDFLAACDEALGSQDESEEATREPAFTLQDLLASSELSSALRARFGTNSVLAMATHPC